MKRTRLFIFPERPDFLLVYVPEGAAFAIPRIKLPMTKAVVAEAMVSTGLPYTVSETTAGRWKRTMGLAEENERNEQRERQREAEAVQATLLRSSNNPLMRDRAETLIVKQKVDERIRAIKDKIAKARAAAWNTGQYLPRDKFIALEQELHDKQNESIALQAHLRSIREEEKKANMAAYAATSGTDKKTWNEFLLKAVKQLLAPDVYEAVKERAQEMMHEHEAQKLDAEDDAADTAQQGTGR